MPRGSKIGERRGGRQSGTPNRRTVLVDRILAIADDSPAASARQFIDMLAGDQQLPADIRIAIARKCLPTRAARPVEVGAVSFSASHRQRTKSSGARSKVSGTAKSAALDMLFSIAQDTTLHLDQRRKAASEAAQHFLPKKPGIRRWWENAEPDEYGFTIPPQIAAEYRDIKVELQRLNEPGTTGPASARRAAKMRGRLKAILHRLQCPCPSLYGVDQLQADVRRLIDFSRLRADQKNLSEKEDVDEARCTARFDSFRAGPECAALQRLSLLKDKERVSQNGSGLRLTWKEQVDLRFLRLLYPQRRLARSEQKDELNPYEPLRDEPLAEDGNLYPVDSKLAPPKEGEIIREFVAVPPYVIGNPNYPSCRWLWELPAQPD